MLKITSESRQDQDPIKNGASPKKERRLKKR